MYRSFCCVRESSNCKTDQMTTASKAMIGKRQSQPNHPAANGTALPAITSAKTLAEMRIACLAPKMMASEREPVLRSPSTSSASAAWLPEEQKTMIGQMDPLKRVALPEAVAGAVFAAASDHSGAL